MGEAAAERAGAAMTLHRDPISVCAAECIAQLLSFAPRVRRPAGARASQLAECEAQLGRPLPADARACYAVANGDLPLWPGTWLSLRRVVLQHRLMCTVAEHLRPGEPGWSAGDAPQPPDATVRRGAWHAGWIPIGESYCGGQPEWLCLDTVPGPAGRWGQLIVVPEPAWLLARGEPVPPARRLADGLLPHLWQVLQALRTAACGPAPEAGSAVRTLLDNPLHAHVPAEWALIPGGARFESSSFWPAWREATQGPPALLPEAAPWTSAAAGLGDLDLVVLVRALSEPWPDRPVPHAPLPRPVTVLNPVRQTEPNQPIEPSTLQWFGGGGDPCMGLDRLRAWVQGKAPPRGLLLGAAGVGKTTLVRELARAMPAEAARPLLHIDLAALVDWESEPPRAPETLAQVFAAQAQRRGLQVDPQALLAALAADRFALVLDHVEALAPCLPEVWRLADAFPAAGRTARILMVCAREWFMDGAQLRAALDALAQWPLDGPRGHWLACLHGVGSASMAEDELCRRLGIEGPRAVEVGSALRGLGLGGVPAGVIAARAAHPRQDADAPAGSTDLALAASICEQWLRVRLPVTGPWEREHAHRVAADLATALTRRRLRTCPSGEAALSTGRLDDLLRRRCGGLSAPRVQRLRLQVVQALMLKQRFVGRLDAEGGPASLWPDMQLVEAMASDDEQRVLAVLHRWSHHWVRHELLLLSIGLLWRQLGHAAPCGAVTRLLQRPHGPRVGACLRALAGPSAPASKGR
jgi:energy-coupling factor transporter ATP-binding protein EcfA2